MTVKEIIESRIEVSEPQDTILAYLKENDGKKLTVRDAKKLSELTGEEITIDKRFGMAHIEWGTWQERQKGGRSLLVAYAEKNVAIDVAFVEEHNRAYFSAKDERNQKRREMLADTEKMALLETKIAEFLAAKDAMENLLEQFPDHYEIEKQFGLD
jgi:hypothetical protein